MNEKTCKELRKTARAMTVGRPERQLVQYQQELNGANQKRFGRRFVVGAVNAPGTTRAVYREMKTGRAINPKRIVMEKEKKQEKQQTQVIASETSTFKKVAAKTTAWFRKFLNK